MLQLYKGNILSLPSIRSRLMGPLVFHQVEPDWHCSQFTHKPFDPCWAWSFAVKQRIFFLVSALSQCQLLFFARLTLSPSSFVCGIPTLLVGRWWRLFGMRVLFSPNHGITSQNTNLPSFGRSWLLSYPIIKLTRIYQIITWTAL